MKNIIVKVFDNKNDLHQLSQQWELLRKNLQQTTGQSSFCLHWLWLSTWCDFYLAKQDKLFIHAYYLDQQLIALFPVYLKKVSWGYQLRFIATGEPESVEVCSEFQDFIIKPAYQDAIFELFTKTVTEQRQLVSFVFENVLESSNVYTWWKKYAAQFGQTIRNNVGCRYRLPIYNSDEEQVLALRSKTTRRHAKKYLAEQTCCIEILENKDDFNDYFSLLIDEHNKHWQNKGKQGVFEQNVFTAFHREFALNTLKNNDLVFAKLMQNNQFVAIFYGIIDGDTLSYYQSAVNNKSVLPSAGVAMHMMALAIAREKNLAFYDFMKGSKDAYKNKYIESATSVFTLEVNKTQYLVWRWLLKLKNKLWVIH